MEFHHWLRLLLYLALEKSAPSNLGTPLLTNLLLEGVPLRTRKPFGNPDILTHLLLGRKRNSAVLPYPQGL